MGNIMMILSMRLLMIKHNGRFCIMRNIKSLIKKFKKLDTPSKISVLAIGYMILACIYINFLTLLT